MYAFVAFVLTAVLYNSLLITGIKHASKNRNSVLMKNEEIWCAFSPTHAHVTQRLTHYTRSNVFQEADRAKIALFRASRSVDSPTKLPTLGLAPGAYETQMPRASARKLVTQCNWNITGWASTPAQPR